MGFFVFEVHVKYHFWNVTRVPPTRFARGPLPRFAVSPFLPLRAETLARAGPKAARFGITADFLRLSVPHLPEAQGGYDALSRIETTRLT